METKLKSRNYSTNTLSAYSEAAASDALSIRSQFKTYSGYLNSSSINLNSTVEESVRSEAEVASYTRIQKSLHILLVLFLLYLFLFALDLMSTSFKVLTGCSAGSLLGDDVNPIGALMIGVLCTVLFQSSSTTTSITVSLTGSGLGVKTAIYIMMGANIGTSVTSTIVAMGQMGNRDELERAFAGATVHGMFNYLSVIVLLPIEVAFHYLYHLTKALVNEGDLEEGQKWQGPVAQIVDPLVDIIIMANKQIPIEIAESQIMYANHEVNRTKTCKEDFYPILLCTGNTALIENCTDRYGLIACDAGNEKSCPVFFQEEAGQRDDEVSGLFCLLLSLFILVACLVAMVLVLRKMLLGVSTRAIYRATNLHPLLAMLVGTGVTVLVQSSSITTSILVPFVGLDIISLEAMYPLTLGANVGTTVTAIMAAQVSDKIESLQVALALLFFNLTGIAIWYPIPFMRNIPLSCARALGKATKLYKLFPLVYIFVAFFALPLLLIGISSLFKSHALGYTALGTMMIILICVCMIYTGYWIKWGGGYDKIVNTLEIRQRRHEAFQDLPHIVEYLKSEMDRLKIHSGLEIESYAIGHNTVDNKDRDDKSTLHDFHDEEEPSCLPKDK